MANEREVFKRLDVEEVEFFVPIGTEINDSATVKYQKRTLYTGLKPENKSIEENVEVKLEVSDKNNPISGRRHESWHVIRKTRPGYSSVEYQSIGGIKDERFYEVITDINIIPPGVKELLTRIPQLKESM